MHLQRWDFGERSEPKRIRKNLAFSSANIGLFKKIVDTGGSCHLFRSNSMIEVMQDRLTVITIKSEDGRLQSTETVWESSKKGRKDTLNKIGF